MFYEFLFHQISLILTPANDYELKFNLKGFYSFFVDNDLIHFYKTIVYFIIHGHLMVNFIIDVK